MASSLTVLFSTFLTFTLTFAPSQLVANVGGATTSAANSNREVVCWGDSMTEGLGAGFALIVSDGGIYKASDKAYPEILQDLTGLTTYNFGVAGATSKTIAAMQGGLDLNLNSLNLSSDAWEKVNLGAKHPGDVLILEIGSNGGWNNDYNELIAQYRAMISHSSCKDYLIIGDTDDPGTSIGDRKQEPFKKGEGPGVTDWEKALEKEFGRRFINMRVYLIENGLNICGLARANEDNVDASYGRIPHRLRSDWTHLSSYGYYAEAYGIYERGLELGYWS